MIFTNNYPFLIVPKAEDFFYILINTLVGLKTFFIHKGLQISTSAKIVCIIV